MKPPFLADITGQDGAYLAESLPMKGCTVFWAYRPTGTLNFWRITA